MVGYIYIIKDVEFVDNLRDIFKIGKTVDFYQRFQTYPEGTLPYYIFTVSDCDTVETLIKSQLRPYNVRNLGYEYFEIDDLTIFLIVANICSQYRVDKKDIQFRTNGIRLPGQTRMSLACLSPEVATPDQVASSIDVDEISNAVDIPHVANLIERNTSVLETPQNVSYVDVHTTSNEIDTCNLDIPHIPASINVDTTLNPVDDIPGAATRSVHPEIPKNKVVPPQVAIDTFITQYLDTLQSAIVHSSILHNMFQKLTQQTNVDHGQFIKYLTRNYHMVSKPIRFKNGVHNSIKFPARGDFNDANLAEFFLWSSDYLVNKLKHQVPEEILLDVYNSTNNTKIDKYTLRYLFTTTNKGHVFFVNDTFYYSNTALNQDFIDVKRYVDNHVATNNVIDVFRLYVSYSHQISRSAFFKYVQKILKNQNIVEENSHDHVQQFAKDYIVKKPDGFFALKDAKELFTKSEYYHGNINILKQELEKTLKIHCIPQKMIKNKNTKNVFMGFELCQESQCVAAKTTTKIINEHK